YAIAGLAISTCCFATLTLIATSAPLFAIALVMGMQGLGIGLGQQVPVLGVQNAARGGDIGAATGTVTLSRMIGGASAISVYGAILAQGLNAAPPVPGIGPLSEVTPAAISTLTGAAHDAAIAGYGATFTHLFMFACLTAIIGLVAAISLRPVALGATAEAPARAPA
ncbi:hypothetical protein MD273_18935, partial [Marinobacter pelagius]